MAKFLIVEARFYDHLNDMLVAGAKAALEEAGHKVDVITVPGALEIPGAVALAAESGRYDGFVAIGVVIRGETYHFEIVAGESARGIMATRAGHCHAVADVMSRGRGRSDFLARLPDSDQSPRETVGIGVSDVAGDFTRRTLGVGAETGAGGCRAHESKSSPVADGLHAMGDGASRRDAPVKSRYADQPVA